MPDLMDDVGGYAPRQSGYPIRYGSNTLADYMMQRSLAHNLGAGASGLGGTVFGGIAATDPEPFSKVLAALMAGGMLSNAGIQAQKAGRANQGADMWAASPYPNYVASPRGGY